MTHKRFVPLWVTAMFAFQGPVLGGEVFTRPGDVWLCDALWKWRLLTRKERPFARLATPEEIRKEGGLRPNRVRSRAKIMARQGAHERTANVFLTHLAREDLDFLSRRVAR